MLLNADVGEGLASDKLLFPYLDQANIACGSHAGNHRSMRQAVTACVEHNIMIGAHPSYPDKENFGRVSVDISSTELVQSLTKQIETLSNVCESLGASLSYIKPHGALYNDIMVRFDLFNLVVELIANHSSHLSIMLGASLPRHFIDNANNRGITIIREAFADRQYLSNGQLSPRRFKGSVFNDIEKISSQVSNLLDGTVLDEDGNSIELNAESICLHGDNPASVQAIANVAQILRS